MLDVVLSSRFRRDLKTAARRGYNFEILNDVVDQLARREILPEKNRDHSLTGEYEGCRECHLAPIGSLFTKSTTANWFCT